MREREELGAEAATWELGDDLLRERLQPPMSRGIGSFVYYPLSEIDNRYS